MTHGNLFDGAEPPATGERFDTLLQHRNLVVERIVSRQADPSTTYVQAQDEWVLLVHGTASLEVRGSPQALRRGDYLFLPAGTPHRVLQVSEGALWLAVHLHPEARPGGG